MGWLQRIADKSVPLRQYRFESGRWATCAISEARTAAPNLVAVRTDGLSETEAPKDSRLDALGREFHRAVEKNQRGKALRVYLAILKRVARIGGVRA